MLNNMGNRNMWKIAVLVSAGVGIILIAYQYHYLLNVFQIEYMVSLIIRADGKPQREINLTKPLCKPPSINPFDQTLLRYVTHPRNFKCKRVQPKLTFINEKGEVCMNQTDLLNFKRTSLHCIAQTVAKGFGAGNSVELGPKYTLLQTNTLYGKVITTARCIKFPRNDMIETKCYIKGNLLYNNVHTYPHLLGESTKDIAPDSLNVYIMVIESLSRSRYLRHMNLTNQYLNKYLRSFNFTNYNKIADNTYPNLMGIFTGKRAFTQQQNMHTEFGKFDGTNDFYDNFTSLVWKRFEEHDYVTTFIENAPSYAIFNYNSKKGFKSKKPFDFYYYPYFLKLKKMQKKSVENCFNDEPRINLQLNISKQILSLYGHTHNHLIMDIYSELGHDHENEIEKADQYLKDHLQFLQQSGHLNKTILLILGDHGPRFGPIRQLDVGFYEERLPFLSISLPDWFLKNHAHIQQSLERNADLLTTPFDIHETLVDIAQKNYKGNQRNDFRREKSLFYPISSYRNCSQAGIPDMFCACHEMISRKPIEKVVRDASNSFLQHINTVLKPVRHLCSILQLKNIVSASEIVSNGETSRTLRILITTTPGEALLEAFVRTNELNNTFHPPDYISRLNKYGSQSRCVTKSKYKNICYCR